ncbi:gltX1 [Symbiodinium sp. CCMP2592]|nr:gltX1 [Symbiodinium sp. CCMP2592]
MAAKAPNAILFGTGEYTTGLTPSGQAKSDKSLGVVALTFFDLRAKGKIGDRIAMVGTNGDKEPKIKEHFSRNLTFPNIGSKEFEFFPKEGKNPKAYLDAIKAFKPGDVCTVFTPDDTHFEICKAALQGGVHVLVTKPMVKTLAQHKELVRIAKEKGALLQIEVHKRFDPIYNDARQRIQNLGDFGYFTAFMSQPKMQLETFKDWAVDLASLPPPHFTSTAEAMNLAYLSEIGVPVACSSTACRTPLPPAPAAQHRNGHGYAAPSGAKARPVVTRFAPSPTGYLHIGGARTALFNYLFAKHHGGKFLMRIEDTDAERHNEAAVDAILQGMAWLGTPHDGEIVRQRENIGRHKEVAAQLLANGGAYKCYCSKEELEAMRAQAEQQHVPFRYSGPWRNAGPDVVPPPDRQPVVRIRTPDDDGVTSWQDGVMGLIEIPNKDVDDFIILRADGTPTYLLAVVVDDHDMGVTQVIRGSDHIGNTARQISVFKNMGWDLPDFAHLPLIHGPDGKKLSKRHGATGLEEFEAKGYLPESIRNYLARLSWSHGDDEIFSTEQAIKWFSLSSCSRGAPCFDFDKLNGLNQHYIKEADHIRLAEIVLKLFPEVAPYEEKLRDPRVANMLKVRAKTLLEYKEAGWFFMSKRPIEVSPAAAADLKGAGAQEALTTLVQLLEKYSGDWSPEGLETCIKDYAATQKVKLGALAKPARAALTGSTASPGLFEVIWAIGRDEVIARLRWAHPKSQSPGEPQMRQGRHRRQLPGCRGRELKALRWFERPRVDNHKAAFALWSRAMRTSRQELCCRISPQLCVRHAVFLELLPAKSLRAGISSDISYYLNSHHIDFHVWAMQGIAKPVSVYALASTGVAQKILSRPCEDTITVTVTWKNNSGSQGHALYTSSWTASKSDVHSQQRFFCQMQTAEVTVDQAHRGYYVAEDDVGFNSCNPLFIRNKPDSKGRYVGQSCYGYVSFERFVDAANEINQGKAKPEDFDTELPTGIATVQVTAILEAGRKSLDEGRAVSIIYDDKGEVDRLE